MDVIEIQGLTKVYRSGLLFRRTQLTALDQLTMQVPQGEIFGFLGPNGAGKSTSIKILLGLVHATSGSAKILGQPIDDHEVRARLGYLPENPAFPSHLRAAEFLRQVAKMCRVPAKEIEQRVTDNLALVGLADRSRSSIREFSRGMLQRLGIAQALINKPELVILDEPLNGLDPYGRRELKKIFQDLRAGGCTVFFSSHILSDAEDLCDRIAILNKGQLIACGPTRELMAEQPGMNLEELFFHKVDENNRRRFGDASAAASLQTIRRDASE